MSLQKFIQNNCLILQLRLSYKSITPLNETHLQHAITANLQELGNVLYLSSNADRWSKTLKRSQPTMNLILSSSNVTLLALVLFNLRGFVNDGHVISIHANDINSMFIAPNTTKLESVYDRLANKWAAIDQRRKSESKEVDPYITLDPWIFQNEPNNLAQTVTGEFVPLSTENLKSKSYGAHEFHGSRFFDFDQHLGITSVDGQYANEAVSTHYESLKSHSSFIKLKPVLYPDFESLPLTLKHWLDGITEEDLSSWKKEEASRLGFLLNGFKGF